tara:strand:- start:256 stop:882 length:627 start_codon:yes stop_codon:yes gene_type:complete
MNIETKNMIVIISSPSGAGKTTICNKLVKKLSNIHLSVSYTTRNKRKNEVNGKDYFFVNKEKFNHLKNKDYFIETANVFNNFYGSPYKNIHKNNNQKNVLFDIDWQGAKKLRKKFNKNKIIDFFILPPSIKELKKRLIKRGRDNNKEIDLRLSLALSEMIHFKDYKYILINENINSTVNKLIKIIEYNLLIESNNIILNKKLKKLIDL